MTPSFPTLEIPYRSLLPGRLDGLLAAGRNLSADTRAHGPLREIPECWVMGEAAGVAAVQALHAGTELRDIDVARLQADLERQGALVHRQGAARRGPGSGGTIEAELAESIHHRAVDDRRAYE
jgi:hypothetical protein